MYLGPKFVPECLCEGVGGCFVCTVCVYVSAFMSVDGQRGVVCCRRASVQLSAFV